MPRITWHLGRWIRTTDWYPDDQLRLYDRRTAQWTGKYVHESVAVDGSIGRLRGELQHFAYRDIADHLETIDRYTTYAARQMQEDGRRAGCCSWRAIRRRRFCATTSRAAASATASPASSSRRSNALLRVPEVREALRKLGSRSRGAVTPLDGAKD